MVREYLVVRYINQVYFYMLKQVIANLRQALQLYENPAVQDHADVPLSTGGAVQHMNV